MQSPPRAASLQGMKTRVAGAILWTYFAWYAWSFYAGMTGLNPLYGPLAVMISVALMAAFHLHRTWSIAERKATAGQNEAVASGAA